MPRYVLNQYSLGNLGGSSVSCGSSALGTGRLALSCFAGVMSGPDVQFGIVSKSIFPKQFCREEAIWEHTKANQHNFSQSSHCSDYMDKKIIFDRFQKTCHGKADCQLDIKFTGVYKNDTDSALISPDGDCGVEAFLFAQVPCKLPVSDS